ncbi:transglutaminase-like cysteine peptidase [Aeromonas veronii]
MINRSNTLAMAMAVLCAASNGVSAHASGFDVPILDKLIAMKSSMPSATDFQKVVAVNRFVNTEISYKPDGADEWATPLQTMIRGHGDCEDYALLKYSLLSDWGVPITSMRLTYGVIKNTREAHMVLVYEDPKEANVYVLDNRRNNVVREKMLNDFVAVYSFNHEQFFLNKEGSVSNVSPTEIKPTERLSKFEAWAGNRLKVDVEPSIRVENTMRFKF